MIFRYQLETLRERSVVVAPPKKIYILTNSGENHHVVLGDSVYMVMDLSLADIYVRIRLGLMYDCIGRSGRDLAFVSLCKFHEGHPIGGYHVGFVSPHVATVYSGFSDEQDLRCFRLFSPIDTKEIEERYMINVY